MQLILDNIVASMVGSAVILMMMFVNHQSRMAATEAAGFYIMQQQVMSFTGTVQRDMQNLSSVTTVTEEDSVFTFFAQVSPTDTTKQQVEYRRKKVGVRSISGNAIPVYQIERWVAGNPAGGSIATITDWNIQAQNAEGNSIADPADTRQVAVGFRVIPPIEVQAIEGVAVGDTRWQALYRPRMLRDSSL